MKFCVNISVLVLYKSYDPNEKEKKKLLNEIILNDFLGNITSHMEEM